MLFDKRTVLCADFSGAPKLPPITFVRAPTLFVVETQYTPPKEAMQTTVQSVEELYAV